MNDDRTEDAGVSLTGDLDKPAVLFLCVHNAGRSQMAAGWLRHLAGDGVDVFSGGTDPGHETNQTAVAAMAEAGIDISAEYPQPWTDEIARGGRHRLDGLRGRLPDLPRLTLRGLGAHRSLESTHRDRPTDPR